MKLPFEILDSNQIKQTDPMTKVSLHNIVCFGSEDGVKLAYTTADKNKWIAVLLPFTTPVVGIQSINLDDEGQPEIIVDGSVMDYGSGGGRQTGEMLIINVDSVPTQIFHIAHSCMEETFGRNDATPNVKAYQRKIMVRQRQIKIAPLNKKKIPNPECEISTIPAGIYIMASGKIKKK